ncbi:MAG TPA: metal-dependent hydrolase, partial [Myxococcaceae bacterium]|nr:metal-dependent hydrolase [Myxococcaceae bacterium]
MASVLAHAALPLIARRAVRLPPEASRRVALVAVACACLPDLDLIGFAFDVRATDPWGHRGLTHSIAFAAGLALVASVLFLRALRIGSRPWWGATAFVFAATAAHGLVDAMTVGDVGVALFAPFEWGRHFLPIRPLPVCPLGAPEYLSRWGLLVFLNEALYLLAPAWLVTSAVRALGSVEDRGFLLMRVAVGALAWVAVTLAARRALPEELTRARPRILTAAVAPDDDLQVIPHADLPGGVLVTQWDALREQGLFDRTLQPEHPLWSSSFFPSWFGSMAGRWQENRLRLIGRTLFGFAPPAEAEARGWLAAAAAGDATAQARLFTLAPAEKVDLAHADFSFPLTRHGLAVTHNGHPRFWHGLCNGISAAAMVQPEPFRVVEVVNPDGQRIRFHPNDVKALLAVAYYWTETMIPLGGECHLVSFDSARVCSMNPAVLVLALANRLGLARRTFMMDIIPTPQSQFYDVASARIHPLGAPHPLGETPVDPELAPRVDSLVEVQLDLQLSSTTLSYSAADRRLDDTHFERVGLKAVPASYRATLALGPGGAILGG